MGRAPSPAQQPEPSASPKVEPATAPAQVEVPEAARALSQAMVAVAAAVKPSVVTVFTERVYQVRSSSPFDDPFFGGFFRDFFEAPRQRPRVEERRSQGLGSGVIISSDGVIVTNHHVIEEADKIQVRTLSGETLNAKLLGKDPQTDLAVIKVEAQGLTPLPLGDSDVVQVGEIVMAVGSPMSEKLAHTVTQGIVSAKGRANVGIVALEDFIQTDAAINPGNSGGALVDLGGRLVGINSAIVTQSGGSQGIGFAIPVNLVKAVVSSIQESGEVVRAWLGVEAQDVSKELAEALGVSERKGVLVANVDPKGPAAKGGLKSGDMIVEMDAGPIESAAQLRNRIASSRPNSKIHFMILRDGTEKKIEVTLEKVPAAGMDDSARAAVVSRLGFRASDVTNELAQRFQIRRGTKAVVVTEVEDGGPAEQLGLQAGDLIASINRQATPGMKEFGQITSGLKAGQRILLQVLRGPASYFVVMNLAD
jgi:serine protease Do